MKQKSVLFRNDEDCEMLEIYIDGKLWRAGNYWDFNFPSDVVELLDKLGVDNSEEDYSYYCEDEDGEEEQ